MCVQLECPGEGALGSELNNEESLGSNNSLSRGLNARRDPAFMTTTRKITVASFLRRAILTKEDVVFLFFFDLDFIKDDSKRKIEVMASLIAERWSDNRRKRYFIANREVERDGEREEAVIFQGMERERRGGDISM